MILRIKPSIVAEQKRRRIGKGRGDRRVETLGVTPIEGGSIEATMAKGNESRNEEHNGGSCVQWCRFVHFHRFHLSRTDYKNANRFFPRAPMDKFKKNLSFTNDRNNRNILIERKGSSRWRNTNKRKAISKSRETAIPRASSHLGRRTSYNRIFPPLRKRRSHGGRVSKLARVSCIDRHSRFEIKAKE